MPSSETAAELTWTTWEELLLASAVKRHGITDWDSVAMELQARTPPLSLLFTSQVCKSKYDDLKRRFNENETEELRKLRVSELKQEVHRYDLSIQSLQQKVKSLEEERERSLKESDENDDGGEPDLGKDSEKERSGNDNRDDASAPPEERMPVGDVSDKENRSFNESSSTANQPAGFEGRTESEPVGTSRFKPDPVPSDSKPASEDSFNDSCDTVAAAKNAAAAASQGKKKGGESAGLRDSVGDSVKESSDVQSSASLTRKRRRREKEVFGKAAVSPATTIKREGGGVKSEPLDVGLLDIIRSHKHGSMFDRRVEYQMHRDKYKNMVRTHMDLETIRSRLKSGSYSSCPDKFYRDLLLLFTNAIVFFPKASIESVTALELRDLVLQEVTKKMKSIQRSDSSPPSNPTSLETKPGPRKPESLLAKHKPILQVCRKRSSISAKTKQTDGKPNVNPNIAPAKDSSPKLKEEESKKTNERPAATGTRSTRRNKGGQTIMTGPPPDSKTNSLTDSNVMRNDRKKSEVVAAVGKKRGAADFLRRIKRNSPLKSGGGEFGNSGDGRRENRKKRGEGRKEAPPVMKPGGGSGKRRKEEGSNPLKQRGVGRPSRKGVEGGGGKRGREGGGAEARSKLIKKRSKR